MSSSTGARRAAAAGLAVALLILTGEGHSSSRALPIRPPVALSLAIDSDHYRDKLQDPACTARCRALRDGLVDSVRALLRASYPFLSWDATSGARDTVEMRWTDRQPRGLPRSQVGFRIRSPQRRMRVDSLAVPFEDYGVISGREQGRWNPDSLRREWLARLSRTLENPDLLVEVFGRIPINAPVTLSPAGRAVVSANRQDIGVSDREHPVFMVSAIVLDRQNNTEDVAELLLTFCQPTPGGGAAYSCEVTRLDYTSHRVQPPALLPLLQRARVTPKSVHVVKYARTIQADAPILPELP